ncbi:MAG: hypothetical protein GY719_13985, partial [bacterium]|nr:hypothetical protein [bacterium]
VLGACLAANGREEEGAALLERSYRVLREVKGEDARQTREARERLATFRAVASDRGYSPSEFESAARISSSER